jgi:hypothetical protein
LALGALLAAGALPAGAHEPANPQSNGNWIEGRVGHIFWARPGLSDTSVDFYKEPELRSRAPVYRKTRFKVLDVVATRPFPEPDLVYRVELDGGYEAYIAVKAFDKQLFREPRPNQTVTTTFKPPLGEGAHVYVFQRSGIFSADPDLIWERIKNEGPRSFRPVQPAELMLPPPADPKRAPR